MLDELVVHGQQPQHGGFISTHPAAKAHNVGEHKRRQPTRICLGHWTVPSLARSLVHYFPRNTGLRFSRHAW